MAFNGGKLYHTYKTTGSGNAYSYADPEEYLTEHAKEALEQGVILLKVDGACSALHREAGEWVFYQRQDNYKGKAPTEALPDGKQLSTYNQGGKEHNYVFARVDPTWTTGKGKRKSFPGPDTYAAIAQGVKAGCLPDPTDPTCPEWITCEWVGSKHQHNMDGISVEHALIPHTEDFLPRVKVAKELVNSDCCTLAETVGRYIAFAGLFTPARMHHEIFVVNSDFVLDEAINSGVRRLVSRQVRQLRQK